MNEYPFHREFADNFNTTEMPTRYIPYSVPAVRTWWQKLLFIKVPDQTLLRPVFANDPEYKDAPYEELQITGKTPMYFYKENRTV